MEITFCKISDERHSVSIRREDGSTERVELNSRSFLRHDLAHFAVELEVPIRHGFWGSVAAGAALGGADIARADALLAESLAGPVQTLMRTAADPDAYCSILGQIAPAIASAELAGRIHARIRELRGHWQATPYRSEMKLIWPGPGDAVA